VNRLNRLLALAAVVAIVATACGTQVSPSPRPTPAQSGGSPRPTPAESPSPSRPAPTDTVRLALDWTPNTNHTGIFVARHEGWYGDAGIELRVQPYTGTTPEVLLAAHQAECGISFHDSMTVAVAAGANIKSVMAILQHTAQALAVLADSGITRPRELDGKVYVGFGYPHEVETVQGVIEADGGRGNFTPIVLDTAAYEALYAKHADFAIVFTAWEGIEAKQRGIDLRLFAFTDYGFPDFYQVVLACDADWLAREPEVARRFVAATVRGFELAASDPDRAAAMLIEENPGVFVSNPDLPLASARFLAEGGYYVDEGGQVGRQTLEKWQAYSKFLYDERILYDADGNRLTSPPDYAALFTNDFLP
jgi:NitT/TauT family transport system substrate-binding protein